LFCFKDCPKDIGLQLGAEYEKGSDIMDVWMDSGVAWHTALNDQAEHKVDTSFVDVVLEGQDQFRGWFQSTMLTSVAVNVFFYF